MPSIQLQLLHGDPRNANVCREDTLEKIRRNIERNGFYPPLIIRPHPKKKGHYMILDGHHRKQLLETLGYQEVECQIWEVNEQDAQLALATLNRLHGEDEPRKRALLIQDLIKTTAIPELVQWIPESEQQIQDLLALLKLDWEETEAKIKRQIEQEQAELPVPFACMIRKPDYPEVDQVFCCLEGKDQGAKLVALCRFYLKETKHHEPV